MIKSALPIAFLAACIVPYKPVMAAQEKPSLDNIVVCASLHGWLSEDLGIPSGDRAIAKDEAAWYLDRALNASDGAHDATVTKYKQLVSARKLKASEAALSGDPEEEAILYQDVRAEIARCSEVGGAIVKNGG